MKNSQSVGINTEKTVTRSVASQTGKHSNEKFVVQMSERASQSNNKHDTANKSRNDINMSTITKIVSPLIDLVESMFNTQAMENFDPNQPLTSKQARAKSASKKANQSLLYDSKKTPGYELPKKSTQATNTKKSPKIAAKLHVNETNDFRFHLSDLSSSPITLKTSGLPRLRPHLNLPSENEVIQTRLNLTDQMNDLAMETPLNKSKNSKRKSLMRAISSSTKKAKQKVIIDDSDELSEHQTTQKSYANDLTLNMTPLNQSNRPKLRRSERLRLKRLRLGLLEQSPYRIDSRHVTKRRKNSGYEKQQLKIRKSRQRG